MVHFEYFEPLTIQEAVVLLNKYGDKAKVLAGGTDLVALMKQGTISPRYIINIGRISDVNYIRFDGEERLRIGALTAIRNIEQSSRLRPRYGMICEAAGQLGSSPVRNVATIGGNLCNAAPSADMAPILMALSAVVKLVGATGERAVSLEEFFTAPGTTVLLADEVLVEIQIPALPARTAGTYLKLSSRGAEDLAIVGVAVVITVTPGEGECVDVRVALGAVAPTPIRAHKAESILRGEKIDGVLIERASQAASDESRPISDVRASAEYRREMVKVLTRNAITQAMRAVD